MEQNKEQMLTELVKMQKAQIQNYENLSKTNDQIIEKQREYIAKLSALLDESKVIMEELMSIIEKQNLLNPTL